MRQSQPSLLAWFSFFTLALPLWEAKTNFVDHTLTDQTSVIHFIEDNWPGGERIDDGSYDALSGPVTGMFNFSEKAPAPKLFLNPATGEPVTGGNQQ